MRRKEPSHSVKSEWNRVMKDEPYDLSVEELLDEEGFAWVTCIVCSNSVQSPWYDKAKSRTLNLDSPMLITISNFRKEYTEWRTDHSVALQCHCCDAMFTVKHVGKANLFEDNNDKVQRNA